MLSPRESPNAPEFGHQDTHTASAALSLPLQTDNLKRKMKWGRGGGGLGRVKLRAFLTPNPHCVTKDTGNTAVLPFTSPTHKDRGEGTKLHAPLTEIKTKGPSTPHHPPLRNVSCHKFKVSERRHEGGEEGGQAPSSCLCRHTNEPPLPTQKICAGNDVQGVSNKVAQNTLLVVTSGCF